MYKLENAELLIKRAHKEVYRYEDSIIKLFENTYAKSDIFNEALNTARVEETGLAVPGVKEVTQIDGKWALVTEYNDGVTLESLMEQNPEKLEDYMEQFVELQIEIHGKQSSLLRRLKGKLQRQINSLKIIDATTRYELLTRLEGMPKHKKLCHGDFNPSNVIVSEDGSMSVIDWAHATQGNASADAAMTYLLFALKDQDKADLYLNLYCRKSDTARQYVQKWIPIVAASQLTKD
ncbi:MAG: phosphotransferase, partial [Agathobacter sp.]|nr:phosphotransferase [Agathobacter sp.]